MDYRNNTNQYQEYVRELREFEKLHPDYSYEEHERVQKMLMNKYHI